jgi:membrane-associated phospholipid phosphatase
MKFAFLVSFGLFVGLALLVGTAPYFTADLYISRLVQSLNFPGFHSFVELIIDTGWPPGVYIFLGIIGMVLLFLRKLKEIAGVLLVAFLNPILFYGLSKWINRARPSADLIRVDYVINEGGFPSGHALFYMLLFGFLIYATHFSCKSRPVKVMLISLFVIMILAMGLVRIYSGHHWPSDILGGYLLGISCLSLAIPYYRKWVGEIK